MSDEELIKLLGHLRQCIRGYPSIGIRDDFNVLDTELRKRLPSKSSEWNRAIEAAAKEGQKFVEGLLRSQGVVVAPMEAGYLTAAAIRELASPPKVDQ